VLLKCLGIGGVVVEVEEDKGNVGGTTAESLLLGVPSGGILEEDVSADGGEVCEEKRLPSWTTRWRGVSLYGTSRRSRMAKIWSAIFS